MGFYCSISVFEVLFMNVFRFIWLNENREKQCYRRKHGKPYVDTCHSSAPLFMSVAPAM